MDIKYLADIKSLHDRTVSAARAEKAATFHLLECLHRVDVTRAYLELGYSSLFMYVHKGLEYSEAQSFERIEAMRLAFRVEAVGASLRAGRLSMTAVAKIATHAKREKLPTAKVAALAQKLQHKSVKEVERVLASQATLPAAHRERVTPLDPIHSRLDITIDEECAGLLQQARELDADPSASMAMVLKRALTMYVAVKRQRKYGNRPLQKTAGASAARRARQITSVEQSPRQIAPAAGITELATESVEPVTSVQLSTEHAASSAGGSDMTIKRGTSIDRNVKAQPVRKHISRKTRRAVFAKASDQCEFRSLITGTRCREKVALQLDHKFPSALGGSAQPQNLQVLCSAHNREKGMRT